MTLRAALYARYSSDQQRAASIEDQFRICREHAEREGWKLAGTYRDAAVSGASVILRPGVQALLDDARRGRFEIVVAEALDRVSRDQADVAVLYKHLRFAGVMIVTLSEGEINELHVGLKGTMNALFLKDLAAKTHRGLRGRIENGKSGGGRSYGYDVVKLHDAAGEPIRGERRINEAEAAIVRRIFREFAAGTSPRTIARRLNEDGIPGAKGKLWSDSVLRGHAKRGTGLLNNELYIGRLIWNRQRFMKNPETGKRVPRINPPGLDRDRGSGAAHRGRRTVAGREGPAGGNRADIRHGHRGDAAGTCQPAEQHPPPPLPALGAARMRRVRRPLLDARPGPLLLLQTRHDGLVLQRQGHRPRRHRGARAGGAEEQADGPRGRRRSDEGVCGGDQPAQPRAPCLGRDGAQGACRHREEDQGHGRGDRGWRLRAGHDGPDARAGGPPGRARRTPRRRPGRHPGHPPQHHHRLPGKVERLAEALAPATATRRRPPSGG